MHPAFQDKPTEVETDCATKTKGGRLLFGGFALVEVSRLAMLLHQLLHFVAHRIVLAQLLDRAFGAFSACHTAQFSVIGHNDGHGKIAIATAVHTHIVHYVHLLQLSLHLAQRNVFAVIQLDQILFPVNHLQHAVRVKLSDVSGVEPAHAVLLLVVFLSFLLILEVPGRHRWAANHNLSARVGLVRDSVAGLFPVHQFDFTAADGRADSPGANVVTVLDGRAAAALCEPVPLQHRAAEAHAHEQLCIRTQRRPTRQHQAYSATQRLLHLVEHQQVGGGAAMAVACTECLERVCRLEQCVGHRPRRLGLVQYRCADAFHDGRHSAHQRGSQLRRIACGALHDHGCRIADSQRRRIPNACTARQHGALGHQLQHVRQWQIPNINVLFIKVGDAVSDASHGRHQIVVCDHHTLGKPRRARGVHDDSNIFVAGTQFRVSITLPRLFQF
eukprot:m.177799 g.177799  ORF g.177799 m.177799 type:complete len:444 (+) comp21400_c0_seq14:278-1609(+)